MRAMQKQPYFSEIQLKFTQADLKDGATVYNFEIGCKVDYAA